MNKTDLSDRYIAGIVLIVLITLVLITLFPFAQIWAINTLFKLSIEYSWLNWFCVMILNGGFGAFSYKGK